MSRRDEPRWTRATPVPATAMTPREVITRGIQDAQAEDLPTDGPTAGMAEIAGHGDARLSYVQQATETRAADPKSTRKELTTGALPPAEEEAEVTSAEAKLKTTALQKLRNFHERLAAQQGKASLTIRALITPLYLAILAVLYPTETQLNLKSLQGQGDDASLIGALGITTALLWLCHFTGHQVWEAADSPSDRKERREAMLSTIALGVIVLVVGSLTFIRQEFFNAVDADTNPLAMLGLQIGVAAAATTAAFAHTNTYADAEDQAERKANKAEGVAQEAAAEVAAIRGEIDRLTVELITIYLQAIARGMKVLQETAYSLELYTETFTAQRAADGKPAIELATPVLSIPSWMQDYARFVNDHRDHDGPEVTVDPPKPDELPAAA